MSPTFWKRVGQRSKQFAFWIGFAAVAIGPPVVFLTDGSIATAGAVMVYGLVLLALGAFDQVSEIAVASFKMTLRQKIEQASATIVQLQEIAATFVAAQLETMVDAHFLAGTSLQRKAEIHDKLMNSLEAIGIPVERRKAVDDAWRNGVYRAFAAQICHIGDRSLQAIDPTGERAHRFRDDYQARVFRNRPVVPPPREIRALLSDHNVSDAETLNFLLRYERYIAGSPPELEGMS